MSFEFATATRIIFGPGKIGELPRLVRPFGTRALLVTGRNPGRAASLRKGLSEAGIDSVPFPIEGEPTVEAVRLGTRVCREGCEFVIGFGGGSAIDAAKAIAALAPNSGEPLDYLEVVGRGQPFSNDPLPFIAVPTTAGTGAEVTRNAVLGSPEHGVKASLRSPAMLAKVALVDPDLTMNLPPEVTVNTGLDALTQVIEPYVSCRAQPLTDLFCREGMRRVALSLPAVYRDAGNEAARESMALASLLGGLSLANAGLGAVHGFAAPLGGMLSAPHGAICAALLPSVIKVNIQALRLRAPQTPALRKYEDVARVLTGDGAAQAEDAAIWTEDLCRQLSVKPLRWLGLTKEQIPTAVERAESASSMKGNPLPLTAREMEEILERSW